MSKLVAPHGGKGLVCALLHGNELAAEQEKAAGLKKIQISGRAKGDLPAISNDISHQQGRIDDLKRGRRYN